jgi:hypothetical protein
VAPIRAIFMIYSSFHPDDHRGIHSIPAIRLMLSCEEGTFT